MLVNGRPFLVTALLIALAVALVLLALPALDGPLVLDSTKLFALERIVEEHGDRAVFHTPAFGGGFHRIVAMATFVLNIQLHGELSVFQLKLTNVGIHVAAGVLVFALTRLLLRRTRHGGKATLIALGTSALWLLSPLNFNVAMYTIQRMTQLSALFTFAGLALYAAGRLQQRVVLRWLYLGLAALVCLPLAVFSKQNGILLVPLAFLVEVYFLHAVRPWFTGRQLALLAVIGTVIGVGLLFFLYPGILNYQHRDFTLAQRLLSESRALLVYVQQLVFPNSGDTGIYTDDFVASRSLLVPPWTLASLAAWAAAGIFCVVCRRGRLKAVSFGIAFFLVGHLLESTFIPLELFFPYRNYLPGYGIYLALACAIVFVLPGRRWVVIALAIYSAYFAVISYARSLTWSSRENMVTAAVHYHPGSPRALAAYAQLGVERGDFDLARAAIDRAIELSGTVNTRVQRLYIKCASGADIAPDEYAALADTGQPSVAIELSQALENLLRLYKRGGCKQLRVAELVPVLDRLTAGHRKRGGDPWTIAYYADAFLYASGSQGLAHRRLQDRLDAGLLRAGLYRVELLIQEQKYDAADGVLSQITTQFEDAELQGFETILEEFRRRIEKRG